VDVPFHARLHNYLMSGNCHCGTLSGLGHPFAAQGDENPTLHLPIVRALLPYSLGNYVTFAVALGFIVFFYLFLRNVGLRKSSRIVWGNYICLIGRYQPADRTP